MPIRPDRAQFMDRMKKARLERQAAEGKQIGWNRPVKPMRTNWLDRTKSYVCIVCEQVKPFRELELNGCLIPHDRSGAEGWICSVECHTLFMDTLKAMDVLAEG
jgi:hypothetical protein